MCAFHVLCCLPSMGRALLNTLWFFYLQFLVVVLCSVWCFPSSALFVAYFLVILPMNLLLLFVVVLSYSIGLYIPCALLYNILVFLSMNWLLLVVVVSCSVAYLLLLTYCCLPTVAYLHVLTYMCLPTCAYLHVLTYMCSVVYLLVFPQFMRYSS
jgi:hypothetical protein